MGRDIEIAIGARTPIYLPLYLAQKESFYGFEPPGSKFTIKVATPPAGGDGDEAVRERVASGKAEFGVCDPRVVLKPSRPGEELVAIAALVTRTGFWIYCKADDTNCKKLESCTPADVMKKLKDDSNIKVLVYPTGMTGHSIARSSIGAKLDENQWAHKHQELNSADMTSDFECLKGGRVLVTSNVLDGQDKEFTQVYAYSCDGQHGNLFTVCLITKQSTIEDKKDDTADRLVNALQMAMIDLGLVANQSDRSCKETAEFGKVVGALIDGLFLDPSDEERIKATRAAAKQVCADEALFPTRLRIDRSMWAKMVAQNSGGGGSQPANGEAHAAYRQLVLRPARRSFNWRHRRHKIIWLLMLTAIGAIGVLVWLQRIESAQAGILAVCTIGSFAIALWGLKKDGRRDR